MTLPDHYKTLGLSKGASESDIKKAYHQLAKQYHPDKNKAANAEEKFKEIGAAYEVLKDASKRRTYDMQRDGEEERKRSKQSTNATGGATRWTFGANAHPDNSTFSEFTRAQPGFNFRERFHSFDDDEFFKRARREFENFQQNQSSKADHAKGNAKPQAKQRKKKDSKTGSQRRATFDFGRPEWNNNWNESDESERQEADDHSRRRTRDSGSFGFSRFMKDPFMFGFPKSGMNDPFSVFDDMFDDFMRDPFFSSPRGFTDDFLFSSPKGFYKPTATSHNKYSTHNQDSGLGDDDSGDDSADFLFSERQRSRARKKPSANPEEDMWDWSKPMFNKKRNKETTMDSDYDLLSDSEEDEPPSTSSFLMSCSYCKRKFPAVNLRAHESVCQRFNPVRGSSRFTENDPEETLKTPRGTGGAQNFTSPRNSSRDWRKEHEDLMSRARTPRRGSKVNNASNKETRSESTPPPPKTPYLVECRWCHRHFNEEAAKRHIPLCEARGSVPRQSPFNTSTQRQTPCDGAPSKTQQAKEYAKNIPRPGTTGKSKATTNPSHRNHGHPGRDSDRNHHKPPTGQAASSEGSTPRMPHIPHAQGRGATGTSHTHDRGDQPFTFTTSSGLHNPPPGGTTRSHGHTPRSQRTRAQGGATGRANVGASETTGGSRNVHFDIPK